MATLKIGGRGARAPPVAKVEVPQLPHETKTVARWAYVNGSPELCYDEGREAAWPALDTLKRRYPDRLWGRTIATPLGRRAPIYFHPAEKFMKEGGPMFQPLETDEPLDGAQLCTQLELFIEPGLAKPVIVLHPANRDHALTLKFTWIIDND